MTSSSASSTDRAPLERSPGGIDRSGFDPETTVPSEGGSVPPDDPRSLLLDGLNDVQRQGVEHGDGALLILAGAGSGKTRVLTHRLAHLVAVHGIPPTRILAVTFTNKAAGEMRERVAGLLGIEDARQLWMGTFHSICLRLLKRHQERLGFRGTMTVFDVEDQTSLIRQVVKELGSEESGVRARDVQSTISAAKNLMLDPDSFEQNGIGPARRRIARIWRAYEARLRAQDGVDFDDILLLTLRLFETNPEIQQRYAERFLHVLVDEYQDTNRAQFGIVRRLASHHGNICVVGDDDQSIYRWRGADITNILEFERHFAAARVLRMEQNYRSTGRILDIANAVIRNNRGRKGKTIWTDRGQGDPVRLHVAEDEEAEAREVARRIEEEIGAGRSPEEIAVLYRTHAQSRPIEEALIRGRIAYRVVGGVAFYQRREVKDLLAYLRLIVNPLDEVSFRRAALAPRRGAGETTCDRIVAAARERDTDLLVAAVHAADWGVAGRGLPALASAAELLLSYRGEADLAPHRLIEEIAGRIDYRGWLQRTQESDWEDRWAHVLEMVEGARGYGESEEQADLAGYLEQVALYAQTDDLRAGEGRAILMTVHNAKGLEYEVVFVTGLEEGLFPHFSSLDDPEELEEERRLFYVAATRARQRLFLSGCRVRRRINFVAGADLSRFLGEIPREMLEADPYAGSFGFRARLRPLRGRPAEPEPFSEEDEPIVEREPSVVSGAGLVARHVRYGTGQVLRIDGAGDRARVEVRFPGWGVKRILRSYLKLEES
ncbi:MAG: AAA family ATPase [Candidatus Eisenbacteria bacterium]|nr:AAA family ATPase [Candidatus Latescibacterota bacterium]MBD3301755.1 AAA family ATPase [Candidatus Eisenbacteria bacterium]